MSSQNDLVAVYTAAGEVEAQIVRGRLAAAGIPSLLRSPAAPSVHPFTVDGMGQVSIMVNARDVARARELLGEEDDA